METSLHRELKERYGPACGGRSEVLLRGFRVDAVTPDGTVVEIQSGALGPLRAKLNRLLPEYCVRIVKPVVLARRVVRRTSRRGRDLSARFSPKRGCPTDIFDDFVGIARIFPHPNLLVEVLAVEIDEIRIPRRRWPGYSVLDRRLRSVLANIPLKEPRDLLALLPRALANPFTTRELAESLGRPIDFAQRVAYCLRVSGAVTSLDKIGNRRVYASSRDPMTPAVAQGIRALERD